MTKKTVAQLYGRGEKTLKLNLLFIAMVLLTILGYPFVFMHGRLRQFSKFRESTALAKLLVTDPDLVIASR